MDTKSLISYYKHPACVTQKLSYVTLPSTFAILINCMLFLGLNGCTGNLVTKSPGVYPTAQSRPLTFARPVYSVAGYSLQHRPINCITIGHGRITTLFIASIHGNEQAGTPLLQSLARHLSRTPSLLKDHRVVIILNANPDGIARNRRYNNHNIDLNRNFPAHNRRNNARFGNAGLTEPESTAIYNIIERYHPDDIVSIHQPLNCIDYDGPALALALKMANSCPLPLHKLGSRPGSLGSYAGNDLHIPIITMELPRNADDMTSDQLWNLYGSALIDAINYAKQ